MYDIILTPKKVTVIGCQEREGNIFLQTQDGTEIQYVGRADFIQVQAKTLNNTITLGVDPSDNYCAFLEDVMNQQVR